jgi:PAS domain S-box-containing protein
MNGRLPRLLGAYPDAMVIVDAQGTIRQANARAVSLFGCRELNGTPIGDLFPGKRAPCDGWWSPRRNQAEHCLELVGSRGDSRRFRAAVTVMPIDTENDAGAVITIKDLTETQETQFILERGLEMLNAVISSR